MSHQIGMIITSLYTLFIRGTMIPVQNQQKQTKQKKNYFLDGLHFGQKRDVPVMFCQIGWQSMNQFHHFRKVIELSDP